MFFTTPPVPNKCSKVEIEKYVPGGSNALGDKIREGMNGKDKRVIGRSGQQG